MRFIQIIESESDPVEGLAEAQGYAEQAGDDVTVQRITICGDRDLPGVTITIAEFESAESAGQNNEAEITQETAANEPDGTTYRNLDVYGVIDL
ncbi:MAG: hypothetical protein HN361_04920 [Actinobacteria bacterium]|jgi:hypothetical protein|nr:hypothetical protein [Actinomycetota bacterium]MBT3746106.1 hypothetical protein [Actinomycetota bacterium]MBT4009726.1 hypothetical protein [Actinomycetota bacterium]MBT4303469.1 hypothetical protein [Actinomycetota bacterium]MBT5084908.1 hypothetical protein [Actinomycetota bacterium]